MGDSRITVTQSLVKEEVWFLKIDNDQSDQGLSRLGLTIQLTQPEVINLAKSVMNTTIGKQLLKEYERRRTRETIPTP